MPNGTAEEVSARTSIETAGLEQLSVNQFSQLSETFMVSSSCQGAVTNNELLGAVLLILLLQYMRSQNNQEKDALTMMMGLLLQMQQQNGTQQSMLSFGSHMFSIESSQVQTVSGQAISNAYSTAGVDPAAVGTGGASLNAVA